MESFNRKWLYIAFVVSLIVLILYFVQFNVIHLPHLSTNQEDWGSFGAYVGGTIGPIFAYLAYLGVREQLLTQKKSHQALVSQKALEDHIYRTKESFEHINILSLSSIVPIEKHLNIELANSLKSDLHTSVNNAPINLIIDEVIEAGHLLHGASVIYQRYMFLIDQASRELDIGTPLSEHKWVARTTWALYKKRGVFLSILAKKALNEITSDNQEVYPYEHKELLTLIHNYEHIWDPSWKKIVL
ncbi:hypothetical protein VMF7928_02461 [Vibrio marisflavi CECT 7928]|uniref:DUF4760 domain-containing protein n=2 Tax=Vibrio marisflavi TaxID=1216040 RepID=A0ABM9A4Q3_9VIBR|nr:hypothetical protein VMF7928_02461 [Vibrio marisflavi CECT 7928]